MQANEQWAEVYRGSGRLTGRLTAEPVYMDNGDVAPGWQYVGDISEAVFWDEFDAEVHGAFHAVCPDFACRRCIDAGWAS